MPNGQLQSDSALFDDVLVRDPGLSFRRSNPKYVEKVKRVPYQWWHCTFLYRRAVRVVSRPIEPKFFGVQASLSALSTMGFLDSEYLIHHWSIMG
ncbi:hypothetical protein EMIT0194MI4_10707 [Pseudomonas sp. IT-194MI4]